MAATLTVIESVPLGASRVLDIGTVAFDNSYPTGGEPIDATGDLGYDVMFFEGGPVTASWDKANQKVLAYWGNAGTASLHPEVTATTDLSAVTLQFLAIRST
jgi:hypothetical protein